MPITLKDIADRTGVSPSVVSTVLSGRDNGTFVSKETRERVMRVAQELNYTPVRAGRPRGSRRLRKQRLDQFIGAWAPEPDISTSSTLEMLQQAVRQYSSMQLESEEFDYDFGLRLLLSDDLSRLDMLGVIGLIILGDTALPRTAAAANTPTVLMGEIDHAPTELVSVHLDNFAAGRSIGSHLWSLGHRKVAFLAPSSKPRVTRQRWQGLQSIWVENNAPADGCVPAPYDTKSGIDFRTQVAETVQGLFSAPSETNRPTAVVCFSESVGAYALQALLSLGLLVPNHVSLATFGDTPDGAEAQAVPLTTVRAPIKQLVTTAVAQLYNIARQNLSETTSVSNEQRRDLAFPGELIVRHSTRAISES